MTRSQLQKKIEEMINENTVLGEFKAVPLTKAILTAVDLYVAEIIYPCPHHKEHNDICAYCTFVEKSRQRAGIEGKE